MEIKQVEYKNIFGFLTGKLKFSRGENFLVGINGCGKTTVLNLIRWVLGPNLPKLCTLQHDLIKIDVKHGKYLYSIQRRPVRFLLMRLLSYTNAFIRYLKACSS